MTSFEEWRPYSVSWGENEAPYEDKDHEFDPERHQVNESIGFDDRNVEMVTTYREIGGESERQRSTALGHHQQPTRVPSSD